MASKLGKLSGANMHIPFLVDVVGVVFRGQRRQTQRKRARRITIRIAQMQK